jgi:hypothetical protein
MAIARLHEILDDPASSRDSRAEHEEVEHGEKIDRRRLEGGDDVAICCLASTSICRKYMTPKTVAEHDSDNECVDDPDSDEIDVE